MDRRGRRIDSRATHIGGDGETVATFDEDLLFDFRARRPTLEIVDGRMAQLTWPDLAIRRARPGGRDVLVLSGAEPDFRWHEFTGAILELVDTLGVRSGSARRHPGGRAAHRSVPIIGTASEPGLLKGDVRAGPDGLLRVPAAALSVLEMAVAKAGTPAVGYFAQVPHYVSGPYAPAAAALVGAVGRHLDVDIPAASLVEEGRQLRDRLDVATNADESTRSYVDDSVDGRRGAAPAATSSSRRSALPPRPGREGTSAPDAPGAGRRAMPPAGPWTTDHCPSRPPQRRPSHSEIQVAGQTFRTARPRTPSTCTT